MAAAEDYAALYGIAAPACGTRRSLRRRAAPQRDVRPRDQARTGLRDPGTVRSFDNKYYTKAAVVEKPLVERPYDLRRVRVRPVAHGSHRQGSLHRSLHHRGLVLRRALRQERLYAGARTSGPKPAAVRDRCCATWCARVLGLVEAGAWIQIDEPAATTRPEEVPLVVETFNATRGVNAPASMHICFSDYNCLFPHIEALDDCYELQLEFSNRDSRELGTRAEDRPGYDVLGKFAQSGGTAKSGSGS